jgi:hypothetical protein
MSCHTPIVCSRPSFDHPRHVFFLLSHTSTMALSASRCASALRIAGRRYPALRAAAPCRSAIGYIQARGFAGSPRWQIRTKEMNDDMLKDLKVNQSRLMEDIHHTCQWGEGERWGEYVTAELCHHGSFSCPKDFESNSRCPILTLPQCSYRNWNVAPCALRRRQSCT